MGNRQIFRGLAAAAALLLSALAVHATTLVPPTPEGGARVADFSLFPFWQKLLTDMGPQPATAVAAPTDLYFAAPLTSSTALAAADERKVASPRAIPTSPACTDQRHCTPQEWTDFLDGLKGNSALAQIEAVNRWANAKPYVEDITNWFIPDYWETPGEFIVRGGDCEDFATIKYFSLLRLGFPAQDMRIMVVSDRRENSFHAVLTVALNGKTWVLDNFLPQITSIESLPNYQPVYSLNEEGWWMHTTPTIHLANTTITAGPLSSERR